MLNLAAHIVTLSFKRLNTSREQKNLKKHYSKPWRTKQELTWSGVRKIMRNLKQGQEVSRSFRSYISRYCLSRFARHKTNRVGRPKCDVVYTPGDCSASRSPVVPSDTFGLTYSFESIGDIACDIHIRLKKWHLVTSDAVSDKMRMPWSNNTQHAMLFTEVTVVEACPHRTVGSHHPVQWAAFDKPASSINHLILQHCQDYLLRCGTAGIQIMFFGFLKL